MDFKTESMVDSRLNVLFSFYHRQWWCYKHQWTRLKWFDTCLNGLALLLLATGMIVGPVLKNSVLVACLAAVGTFVKGWNDFKQYRHKLQMNQFAYTTYAKALIELPSYERGCPSDGLDSFVLKMSILDEVIVDLTPPLPKLCVQHYQQTYQPCEVDSYKSQDTSIKSLTWRSEPEESEKPNEEEVALSFDENHV